MSHGKKGNLYIYNDTLGFLQGYTSEPCTVVGNIAQVTDPNKRIMVPGAELTITPDPPEANVKSIRYADGTIFFDRNVNSVVISGFNAYVLESSMEMAVKIYGWSAEIAIDMDDYSAFQEIWKQDAAGAAKMTGSIESYLIGSRFLQGFGFELNPFYNFREWVAGIPSGYTVTGADVDNFFTKDGDLAHFKTSGSLAVSTQDITVQPSTTYAIKLDFAVVSSGDVSFGVWDSTYGGYIQNPTQMGWTQAGIHSYSLLVPSGCHAIRIELRGVFGETIDFKMASLSLRRSDALKKHLFARLYTHDPLGDGSGDHIAAWISLNNWSAPANIASLVRETIAFTGIGAPAFKVGS